MPLLFFLVGFIFILLISVFSGWILWWAGAVCLSLLFLRKYDYPFPFTSLSIAFIVFILVLFINGVILNKVYHGEIVFYILFFILPFIVFSRLDTLTVERFFKGSVFIFALLVIWGIIQHVTGSWYIVSQGTRANAIFYTPNTFETGINLFLLPFIALFLAGVRPRLTYWLSLLFFAGLMATQSRGGYLGLTFGMLFLALFNFIGHGQLKWNRSRWARLALGFLIVILLFQFSPSWSGDNVRATIMEGHTSDRLELYNSAWQAIKANPLWGYGYFNFGYIFERYKIPPFTDKIALFVHNDYLQIWLEAGLPGLLAFLSVIGVFYLSLWKRRSDVSSIQNPEWLPVIGAALTSLFSHAVVDFPLYVPTLQFLSGAYLGTLAGFLRYTSIPKPKFIPSIPLLSERIGVRLIVVKGLAAFVFLLWLLQPAIAQFASEQGLEGLKKGDVKSALKKIRLAQRLVPGNAYYYWCNGIILRDQAVELQNRDLAALADSVFATGTEINQYYPDNFIERLRLHRDHRDLLEKPANPETLLQWIEHVRTWNPHLLSVKIEYARTLLFVGKKKEAIIVAKQMQSKHPESKVIKTLINDLEQGVY
ncbi:MAG: O-antigen ligase family protein [Nitrospirae bacterium]|nr:O-antigen ligase family protein [Nitrospirota bacterium]